MKLAFAVFKYFPFGGMQRNMLAIARECVARGHQVTLYTGEWQGDSCCDLEIRILAVKGMTNHSRNKNFAKALQKKLANKPVDAVIGFNRMPGLDVYYAGDSCFAAKAYEDRSWFYRSTPRSKMSLAFEEAVFGLDSNTHILLVSELERPVFEKYYLTPANRFDPLPPGISHRCILSHEHDSQRRTIRFELGVDDSETLLLALGSGFRTKGLDRSIELLSELPDNLNAKLIVVGQDKSKPFVRQAKSLGISERVLFLSGRDDVPAILQAADMLVHPAYRENTGNVLLEAMVSGLPVVTTDVCGYAHYVTSGDMGEVIASPFKLESYLQAVQHVLNTPREAWQKRGKIFAESADIYDRPKRAVELIEEIVGEM